ncbi:hypothetical protein KNU84_gp081 [Bacteriophage DSS3_VP1]|uniref:Uncharacterized protein n=1 Tax=Bacteriophage DSS3_VP1 TaxID=2664196 RepID=A0A7S5FXD1_9CAUD|nr:hypothetical protein KNU84_gp081 [Bacteriophage DSS3_VP1]QGH74623.1 hypothetical protein DSS3VP1_00055 [Bacteriophage DSS3_VP1]
MENNFKAGDLVRLVWNGILDKKSDEILVVAEGDTFVVNLNGRGGRILYGMDHKFELITKAGEWGVLKDLNLKEGDEVAMVCKQGPNVWCFLQDKVSVVGVDPEYGLSVDCVPINGITTYEPPNQIFRVVSRKKVEQPKKQKQEKTMDRSDNGMPNYNVTGWGNTLNAIPLAEQPEVKSLAERRSYDALGREFGIAASTAWRIVKLHTQGDDQIIAPQGDYDKNFRMRACILANRHGARQAAAMMGCSVGSVYNWIKAYDMANTYFNPKQ